MVGFWGEAVSLEAGRGAARSGTLMYCGELLGGDQALVRGQESKETERESERERERERARERERERVEVQNTAKPAPLDSALN